MFLIIHVSDKISFYFNEVFVNEVDGQLWAAHIILGYTPISFEFQAPKCVIKAKDPQLHRINVAHEGFIVPEGIPIPKGTPFTQPLFVGISSVGASSSQPILLEEEEDKENEEKEQPEKALDFSDSLDRFEVFNQPLFPENTLADLDHQQQVDVITLDEMGIQRKSQRNLLDLIES